MKIIYNKGFLEHETGPHPESKRRLEAFGNLEETKLEVNEAQLIEHIRLVHSNAHIDLVKRSCERSQLIEGDTVTVPGSYKAAFLAVQATVLASEQGGFALVRPPGHHANPELVHGFCLFNNIAIAAARLAKQGKRVLIFDFDGHYGDGTMKAFYASDQVMYWSLHQFPAFPGIGDTHEIGEGKGKGFTLNIPLPPESGDDIFMEAIERTLPTALQFKPDIVGISAGFDAHQADPLLQLRVSLQTFFDIGRLVQKHFKGAFATLEGGYNIDILPKATYNFIDGVNGTPKPRFTEPRTDSRIQTMDEFQERMVKLERNLKPYWRV